MYSFRITTNGTMRAYRSNLTNSRASLNNAMEKVMTGRSFTSSAENPTAASRSFLLRRDMWRNEDHITNTKFVASKYQTAWVALDPIVDGDVDNPGLDGIADLLGAITDTAGAGRKSLGQSLLSKADSILQGMNARYGDVFVFAGIDGLHAPFSWSDEGKLLYRGIDVDAAAGTDDYKKLQAMCNEKAYTDIGLGFQEETEGVMLESSAYNSVLCGLDFLGYGIDADGDSKNLVNVMKELGKIFYSCDPDTGAYPSKSMSARADDLVEKLRGAIAHTSEKHVKLTAEVDFLNRNLTQLNSKADDMQVQRAELEDVDPAYAITEMAWAQYSYNAALRIGNDILSQSLLDYMR